MRHPGKQPIRWHGTDMTDDHEPVTRHEEAGHAAHAQASRGPRGLVDIDADHLQATRKVAGHRADAEGGGLREGLTGRPEVDEHWPRAPERPLELDVDGTCQPGQRPSASSTTRGVLDDSRQPRPPTAGGADHPIDLGVPVVRGPRMRSWSTRRRPPDRGEGPADRLAPAEDLACPSPPLLQLSLTTAYQIRSATVRMRPPIREIRR